MKVLVTGGAGFIGSHIVDALVEQRHDVAVVDDLSGGSPDHVNSRASMHRVDITDSAALEEVFERERPEIVDHHAAQISVRESMADPVRDARVNVLGTVAILQLCVKYGVGRVIFASSSAVYSEPQYYPMDEGHEVRPQSAYGVSKLAAESYVRLYGDVYGIRYKLFRYGNVYGPRQNPEGEAGVVSIFARQLEEGTQPTIFGDGTKTRDYVYVADIARANLLALGDAGDNEVFNIARGAEVSDLEVFDAVRRATGSGAEPAYAPKRPGEADRVGLDRSKARLLLGWEPQTAFADGVRQAVAYVRGRQGR